ncbi:MAG: hypothetical protein D6683_12015 [Actinomyces sp.]|nr:MAG: hypothetical protein D6683_12015 [Actinomyces sp.]
MPWDEARELLVIVLAAAALLWILQPVVEVLTDGVGYGLTDDLQVALRHVDPLGGALMLAAAVVLASTPAVDVVPRLRRGLGVVTAVVAVAGIVALGVELVGQSAAVEPTTRLQAVMARSGPGALLSVTAWWMVARVRAFPPA